MQYILYGMKHDGNPIIYSYDGIYLLYGMKHDEKHSYLVIMWNKSQGKCNIMIVWDEI
jgi:hypothetical protein